MKKTIVKITSALLLIFVLAGCSDGAKGGKDNEYGKKMTFTVSVLDAEKTFTAAHKKMCEKFNVEFDTIPLTSSDWNEKTRIWMATGDMPDIMWANIQNYNFSEYREWADQGLLHELPDFSKYPNIQKYQSKLESAPYFKLNGKTYAYLSPRIDITENHISSYQFMYRRDWVEKMGMLNDNDEYTWDEFMKIAKAMAQEGVPGLGKKIGLVGASGAFPHFAGFMQISPYWEQYFKKDGKYVWGLGEPETTKALLTARDMYESGVLWSDQAISTGNDVTNKFMTGEAGIVFGAWEPATIERKFNQLAEIDKTVNDVYKTVRPMYVKAPNGKLWGQTSVDYWTITVLNKNLSDDEVDRILKIYDWMLSDEGRDMFRYGIEGEDYVMENGAPKQTSDNLYSPLVSMVYIDNTLAYESKLIDERARNVAKEILDRLSKDDVSLRVYDYPLYFFSGPKKDKYGLYYEEGRTKINELIMKGGDVEKEWNNWKKSVQSNVDLVLDELNTSLK